MEVKKRLISGLAGKKKKAIKKRSIGPQNMIEGGTYWSDKSAPESVEDGCLLLGLTQDVIDLD